MKNNPNAVPVYEVIYDGHVWGPDMQRDEVYRIWGVEEICSFLDQFPLAVEAHAGFEEGGMESLTLQVGPAAFVTLNRLPLYPLSNLENLKKVLEARNILKAA